MLLSVVIPVHNDEGRIRAAIANALGQEEALGEQGVGLEVVVVDDGSDDGSAEVVAQVAAQDARVVAVPLSANGGVARARRAGVEAASGEWVWFVDSDDRWFPHSAAMLLRAATAGPWPETADAQVTARTDVVVAGARVISVSGRERAILAPRGADVGARDAVSMLLRGQITGHLWNKLFRRALLLDIDFTPSRTQSDLAMVAQALAAAGRVRFTSETVYEYVKRRGSVITAGGRRAESLGLVGGAVRTAVGRTGLDGSSEHDYFEGRYLVLSGIKDAVLGDYAPHEREGLLRSLRSRIGVSVLRAFLVRGDWRRLVLALSARTSPRVHRHVLRVADR